MMLRVKYYDRKLSHKGRGTQVRMFRADQREEAEAFAAANQIYSGPCRVEEVADAEPAPAPASSETLTEALAKAGFGHRPPERSGQGGRVVFSLATGEPVKRNERGDEVAFTPAAAWEFLRSLPKVGSARNW